MTAVGFEPTPFRTSALSWRLRPLGQAICDSSSMEGVTFGWQELEGEPNKQQVITQFQFDIDRAAAQNETSWTYNAKSKKQNMTAVGFEPTRIAPPELESGALDRSAKLSLVT